MYPTNVNSVVITGNLTQEPELRSTAAGTSVCEMRVAVNGRRKDASGEWVDKPNFLNVVVFGALAENCATYLEKGRPVAIEGRLDWREWEAKDGGGKRQAVQIIANMVQFLGRKGEGGADGGEPRSHGGPADEDPVSDFGPVDAGEGAVEEDIPF